MQSDCDVKSFRVGSSPAALYRKVGESMQRSYEEMKQEKFWNAFKIAIPKRWKQCRKCRDYFRDELMYYRKVWRTAGLDREWYCAKCYPKLNADEER